MICYVEMSTVYSEVGSLPEGTQRKPLTCSSAVASGAFWVFVILPFIGLVVVVPMHVWSDILPHDVHDAEGLSAKSGSVAIEDSSITVSVADEATGNSADVFVASAADCVTSVRVNNHSLVSGSFEACVNGTNMTVVLGDSAGETASIELADDATIVVGDNVAVHTASGDPVALRLYAGEHYTGFRPHPLTEGDIEYTMPRYAGTAGKCLSVYSGMILHWADAVPIPSEADKVLTSDAEGSYSWQTPSGGGDGGFSLPSGGSSGQYLTSNGTGDPVWSRGIPAPNTTGSLLTSDADGSFSWQEPPASFALPPDGTVHQVLASDGEGSVVWADVTTLVAGDKHVSIDTDGNGRGVVDVYANRIVENVETPSGQRLCRDIGSDAETLATPYHNLLVAGRVFLTAYAWNENVTSPMSVRMSSGSGASETSMVMETGDIAISVGDQPWNRINVMRTAAVTFAEPPAIMLHAGTNDGTGVLLSAAAEEMLAPVNFRFPPAQGDPGECIRTSGSGNHHYGACGSDGAIGPTGPAGPVGPSGFVSVNGIAATNEPFDGAILSFSNTLGNRWVSADYLTNYVPEPRSECYLANVTTVTTAATHASACGILASAQLPVSSSETTRIVVTVVLPPIGVSSFARTLIFQMFAASGEDAAYELPVTDPTNTHVYSMVFTRSVASGTGAVEFVPMIDGVLATGGSVIIAENVNAGATTVTARIITSGTGSCTHWPRSLPVPFIQLSSTRCDTSRPSRACAYTDNAVNASVAIPSPACGSGPLVGPIVMTTGGAFQAGDRHVFAEFDYRLWSENQPRIVDFVACNNDGAGACLFPSFRVPVDLTAHGTSVDRFRFRFVVRTTVDSVASPTYAYEVIATPLAFDGTPLTRSQSRFGGEVTAQFTLYMDVLLSITADTPNCADWAGVATSRAIGNVRVTSCV